MYEWNMVYNLVMNILKDYELIFGKDETTFMDKIHKLGRYNNIFNNLDITSYKDYILIRYKSIRTEENETMWTQKNSIYRECRSLVLDIKNKAIVLAPFRKFFNLEEYKVEENTLENVSNEIQNADLVEILDKLDGSMLSARWYNDDFVMAGTMALDKNNSKNLEKGYEWLMDNHKALLKENSSYTCCFEYISLDDMHTVVYTEEDEGLYLTGMRNVYTGEELPYNKVIKFAEKYNIKHPKVERLKFNELLDLTKSLKAENKEGWVMNIITKGKGRKIKIKTDDYINLSTVLRQQVSINNIIQNIADDTFDDLLSKIPEGYRTRVLTQATEIYKYKKRMEETIEAYYNRMPQGTRKECMIWIDKTVPNKIKGYMRIKYLDLKYNVLKNGKKYKNMSDIK